MAAGAAAMAAAMSFDERLFSQEQAAEIDQYVNICIAGQEQCIGDVFNTISWETQDSSRTLTADLELSQQSYDAEIRALPDPEQRIRPIVAQSKEGFSNSEQQRLAPEQQAAETIGAESAFLTPS